MFDNQYLRESEAKSATAVTVFKGPVPNQFLFKNRKIYLIAMSPFMINNLEDKHL
jgi:hypothetical protein